MKNYIKKIFKSEIAQEILARIVVLYISFVSLTSIKKMEFEGDFSKDEFYDPKKVIFALWHEYLAISIIFFKNIGPKIRPLVSPHSDGMILGRTISLYGCRNIYGSTNKDSIKSVKEIIRSLNAKDNIVITPDGPKGPARKINSNISSIAEKFSAKIIVVNFEINKFYSLKTWDKMKIPLPFSKITIKFRKPLSSREEFENFANYLDQKI